MFCCRVPNQGLTGKLFAQIHETARRIWLHFASSYPQRQLWPLLVERLRAGPT